ncbi:MAG: hypothetical protein PHE08_07115, partial [Bacteroidales bacterium]|nr:hypothetical protein [Bacteroidales bacterium]
MISNNPFQITFTLKQHTPIIHFQHDQDDATLRASEVKPRLDRFILTKLGAESDQNLVGNDAKYKKGIEVAKKRNWLVGDEEHAALNYKLKIKTSDFFSYPIELPRIRNNRIDLDDRGRIRFDSFSCFFGNMGDDSSKKLFTFSIKDIICQIVSNCDDLINYINQTNRKILVKFF